MKDKIFESVPNFSEGKDQKKINEIIQAFKNKNGVKLLNCESDKDHNRCVVTVIGKKQALEEALLEACSRAVLLIDLNKHKGKHPRIGAVDVIPFIPILNASMEDAVKLSKSFARKLFQNFKVPVFLYENSAQDLSKKNLADIRRGEFENLAEKIKNKELSFDFGDKIHKTAGASVVGAREILIAYNINLNTKDFEAASEIAKKIRFSSGGLRYCKAIALNFEKEDYVQISINIINYKKSSLYTIFELVKTEAKRYGISIKSSELVGLSPVEAILDAASFYLQMPKLNPDKILEFGI